MRRLAGDRLIRESGERRVRTTNCSIRWRQAPGREQTAAAGGPCF